MTEHLRSQTYATETLQEEDIPSLLDLEQETFAEIDQWSEAAMREEFSKNPDGFRIIKEAATVIGYVQTQVGYDRILDHKGSESDGIIGSLAVAKAYRSKHLGDLLFQTSIDQLVKKGISNITFSTRRSNRVMLRLGEKYGFQPDTVSERYYDDDEDAIIMKYQANPSQITH